MDALRLPILATTLALIASALPCWLLERGSDPERRNPYIGENGLRVAAAELAARFIALPRDVGPHLSELGIVESGRSSARVRFQDAVHPCRREVVSRPSVM